jgi:hypothetical protein
VTTARPVTFDMCAEHEISVVECASGEEEGCYWVSLGLANPEDPFDTLHIVCGKEADSHPLLQGLYFERNDQGQSEYDLASRISVSQSCIAMTLNDRGVEVLELPSEVRFVKGAELETWDAAVQILRCMAGTPNGGAVDRADVEERSIL